MAERAHPDDSGFQDNGPIQNIYRKCLYDRYEFCNEFTVGKIVLDVPCGTGWGTSLLRGAKKIYGVDISQESILFANQRFGGHDITFQQGSMASLPFERNSLDLIICLEGFEHVQQEVGLKFLDEANRTLNKSGLLIMTIPILTNGRHSGNPYHLYEPSHDEIQALLSERFRISLFEIFAGPDSKIVRFVGAPKY